MLYHLKFWEISTENFLHPQRLELFRKLRAQPLIVRARTRTEEGGSVDKVE